MGDNKNDLSYQYQTSGNTGMVDAKPVDTLEWYLSRFNNPAAACVLKEPMESEGRGLKEFQDNSGQGEMPWLQ